MSGLSQAGIDLIKRWEGLRLTAYRCAADRPTIGYGHTETVTAEDVARGRQITEAEADTLLRGDLAWATDVVRDVLHQHRVEPTQGMFDALVSFTFNVGAHAFKTSTLVRELAAGRPVAACAELARWHHVKGRDSRGLLRRRIAEMALWMGVA